MIADELAEFALALRASGGRRPVGVLFAIGTVGVLLLRDVNQGG